MKYAALLCSLATLAWTFTVTSVYLQAIDRIIQKLLDNLELKDFQVLSENIEVYNEHATGFVEKLKAKDPAFRRIAIEHCRVGKPEFPDCLNIHAFQLNLGWNDTQAEQMFNLVNVSRHLWMAFEEILAACSVALVLPLKTSTYIRGLDKIIQEFLGNIKHGEYDKLCHYIESYNNFTREFIEKVKEKDPDFRRIVIVHFDWGKPKFSKYHDRQWYEVWMEWNDTQLDYLDTLDNTTKSLWREFKDLCMQENYSLYMDRFKDYIKSSETLLRKELLVLNKTV